MNTEHDSIWTKIAAAIAAIAIGALIIIDVMGAAYEAGGL